MTDADLENLADRVEVWRDDPVGFAADVLGARLWSVQREILESVRDNERTAVRSCHASGKTFDAAVCVLWFLLTHSPSKIVTTAPTWRQVEEILWSEINRLWGRCALQFLGRCLQTKLAIGKSVDDKQPDWFAIGLSTDEPDRFQGFHSPNVLVIVDEASGVHERTYAAIEGILSTGGQMRLLLIGNPIKPVGVFHKAFADDSP